MAHIVSIIPEDVELMPKVGRVGVVPLGMAPGPLMLPTLRDGHLAGKGREVRARTTDTDSDGFLMLTDSINAAS